MSEPDQPFQHMLQIEVPDEAVAGAYADFAAAWHTPDVFILDFATLKGAPQSVETESGPGVMSVARVVSRVRISPAQVFELEIPLPDVVSMQTRQANLEGTGEIQLRRLVKEALRMRPDRIIVGEVRQEECLDLLIALNSGLPGMCSIHANSAREAIVKMCTLPLLAGENVGHGFAQPSQPAQVPSRSASTCRHVRAIFPKPAGRSGRTSTSTECFYAARCGPASVEVIVKHGHAAA